MFGKVWKQKKTLGVALLAAIVFAGLLSLVVGVVPALATPPDGISASPIAAGALDEPIRAKFKDGAGGFGDGTDVTNLMMVKFDLQPGGTFGWHEHGGPVWAIIASGTLTLYDEACQAETVSAGGALLDAGNHTHIAYNHGSEPVEIYATFMLPAGGAPRIDAPDPGTCTS
ncbi:MAG: cupin domain-containing protein [Candidatus Promineifilaceae bacterium]|nr:cupin domain-containing protein [Candidatus Promineifilaceae bacterium]